jgi:hypothetical protein
VPIGRQVRFEGVLYYDFEHGTWVGNHIAGPPPPGQQPPTGADADFVCANLDTQQFARMARLSGRPVIGTVAAVARRAPGDVREPCALRLTEVRVSAR